MYEMKTGGPEKPQGALQPPRAMHWRDGTVLHACEALLLTESMRTSVIITACGKSPPEDDVAFRSDSDPPIDCPLCLWHLARVW